MKEVKGILDKNEYHPGRILLVDDEEPPRKLLRQILQAEGHEVWEAESADDACRVINEEMTALPDVVLLDVMMPGRNGYELCRQLKTEPETAHIPVLLVSGLSDREDRLKGIEAGANDFIGKPIDRRNVVLRVRNAVHGKHLHDRVGIAYRELKQLEKMRDNLIHMIVHDLRSPLTGALGYLELLQITAGDKLEDDETESLASIYKIIEISMAMINSVLDVHRLENKAMPLEPHTTDLVPLMNRAIEMLTPKTSKHIVIFDQADEQVRAHCDPVLTQRVFINLVMNSAAFAPVNSEIAIRIVPAPNEVVVQVNDNGPGISEEDQKRIFDKFAFAENDDCKQHSIGLGLAFCKLAMEAQQGNIGVSSKQGHGSTFWLSFPAPTN